MIIWETDGGTTHFELTEQENAAIDMAKAIVERRAKEEGGNYSCFCIDAHQRSVLL